MFNLNPKSHTFGLPCPLHVFFRFTFLLFSFLVTLRTKFSHILTKLFFFFLAHKAAASSSRELATDSSGEQLPNVKYCCWSVVLYRSVLPSTGMCTRSSHPIPGHSGLKPRCWSTTDDDGRVSAQRFVRRLQGREYYPLSMARPRLIAR